MDRKIGWLSQRQGTVHRVHIYERIWIGRPGLAVPYLPGIATPAIYWKTPVQSGANLTLYICTIVYCTHIFCTDYLPARRGSAISQTSVYICIYIYLFIYFTVQAVTTGKQWVHTKRCITDRKLIIKKVKVSMKISLMNWRHTAPNNNLSETLKYTEYDTNSSLIEWLFVECRDYLFLIIIIYPNFSSTFRFVV